VVQVGDPIPIASRRDREAAADPVMEALRTQLGGMLKKLSDESPRI
jgi:hypothetical protein